MIKSSLLRSCASLAIAGVMLAANTAHAETTGTVVDGNEATGYVITDAVPNSNANAKVVNSTTAPTVIGMNGTSRYVRWSERHGW
nr:hypothetical protein [uncultured Sphingorhabdus sp.]